MRKRVASKVAQTRFTCGCPVPGAHLTRWSTFVRAMRRLREFRFLDTKGRRPR